MFRSSHRGGAGGQRKYPNIFSLMPVDQEIVEEIYGESEAPSEVFFCT